GLDLGLARASGSDSTAEALEMRPQTPHPGAVRRELGELDLELALRGVSMRGEDVEDDRGAIDHGDAERRLEISLLTWGELVIAGDEVRVACGDLGLQVLELAGADVGVGMRAIAVLDDLADGRHARRAKQLLQFGQVRVIARRDGGDHQGALASAPLRLRPIAGRLTVARFRLRHY